MKTIDAALSEALAPLFAKQHFCDSAVNEMIPVAIEAIKGGLRDAGLVVVPIEPELALLNSMGMRFGLDCTEMLPGYFQGHTEQSRDTIRAIMRQLHEEVVGTGFYRAAQK